MACDTDFSQIYHLIYSVALSQRNHNILLTAKLFKLFLFLKRKGSSLKDEDGVVSPSICFLHPNKLTKERLKLISEIPIAQNHDLIGRDYHPEMASLKGGS